MSLFSHALLSLRLVGRIQMSALAAVKAFILRGIFVVSAVALGIAALTVIVAAVDGGRKKALEIVDWFGPDAAFVLGGDIRNRPVGQRVLTLSWADAERIAQSLPGAYKVLPMRAKFGLRVKAGNTSADLPTLVGATENYGSAWNWPLVEGRDLTREDVERGAKVALIGDETARNIFGQTSPIGQIVRVGDLAVRIVGRLAYRGVSGGGGGQSVDDRMVIPLTTLTQRFNMDRQYFRALRVKFYDPSRMADHVENLRALLRHNHHLQDGEDDDFTILTAQEILKFLTMFTGGLVVFLGITATVAIFVGGFVLANLMYLSVSERKQEIGLRKAVGATRFAITIQFLSEAVYLTLLGSFCGIGLGIAIAELLTRTGQIEIVLSTKIFVLSTLSSVLIAIAFGLKPARQAAAMNPIEALRGGGD
ncbi:ABC transporter permease [Desulfovibrio inopinatus]|uniref:ABC transporter permease n=1 Tax=Desulfovibrio inopinatus TaxID=102109 RepID=UPI00040D9C79|nr:ABC transporter permease [Desulfovibrio inopinatus]